MKNNPQAFPSNHEISVYNEHDEFTHKKFVTTKGMTLRDWYKGQALIGVMSQPHTHTPKEVATICGMASDAMLLERSGNETISS